MFKKLTMIEHFRNKTGGGSGHELVGLATSDYRGSLSRVKHTTRPFKQCTVRDCSFDYCDRVAHFFLQNKSVISILPVNDCSDLYLDAFSMTHSILQSDHKRIGTHYGSCCPCRTASAVTFGQNEHYVSHNPFFAVENCFIRRWNTKNTYEKTTFLSFH